MRKPIATAITLITFISMIFTGCSNAPGNSAVNKTGDQGSEKSLISVGFSQVGAESDWRNINTESMKEAFSPENGFDLIYDDGQQKQQNQITAIRTFIQKEVDYIVLAPVIEDGWNTVLTEARDADIPVILVDRMVNVDDPDLQVVAVSRFPVRPLRHHRSGDAQKAVRLILTGISPSCRRSCRRTAGRPAGRNCSPSGGRRGCRWSPARQAGLSSEASL